MIFFYLSSKLVFNQITNFLLYFFENRNMHKQKQKNSNSRLRDAQEIPSFKTFRKSPLPCIHKERQYEANSEIKNKSNKYLDKKMSYLLSSNIQDLF